MLSFDPYMDEAEDELLDADRSIINFIIASSRIPKSNALSLNMKNRNKPGIRPL